MKDDEIYEYLGQQFEWDRAKAARNAMVHTVVGWSVKARSLLVVHVWRGQRIRIISARAATAWERREHDREISG